MTEFRKKPVVINAVQVERKFFRPEWLVDALDDGTVQAQETRGGTVYHMLVSGSAVFADEGDWIIRDEHGEFYTCKPGVFEETYDKA